MHQLPEEIELTLSYCRVPAFKTIGRGSNALMSTFSWISEFNGIG